MNVNIIWSIGGMFLVTGNRSTEVLGDKPVSVIFAFHTFHTDNSAFNFYLTFRLNKFLYIFKTAFWCSVFLKCNLYELATNFWHLSKSSLPSSQKPAIGSYHDPPVIFPLAQYF